MPGSSALKTKAFSLAPHDRTLQLRLFGALELENSSGRICENRSRQSLSWLLLKYLLVNPGREIPRDELLGSLWPDPSENGESASRVRLRRLREALIPLGLDGRDGLVLYSQGKYMLNPDIELYSDEDELLRLLARIRMLHTLDPRGPELCAQALELLRGEFLEFTADAPWLEPYRDYYRRETAWLCRSTLERCAELEETEPIPLLCRRSAALIPADEELHRALISHMMERRMELELLRHITTLSRSGKAPWLDEK